MKTAACVLLVTATLSAFAEPLTLPRDARPEWLRRDGIVMAGSWEPLMFRVRRDGGEGYTPTAEQRAGYARERSAEMIERLKALGVNFVMSHCYKGAGLEAERESMQEAAEFAKRCREAGLRVGVYTYSGAFLWEPLFQELPEAREWLLLDENGQPRPYGGAAYRYYWDRNHPDAQAFYKKIVAFAVNDIRADLIHFDNYVHGPGSDRNSVERFRQYLDRTLGPEAADRGPVDAAAVRGAMSGGADSLLYRAWLDFHAQSLADSYADMGRYARTLRPDVLLECNPGGAGARIDPRIDHGRLLQGGEAYWDEGPAPGLKDGRLHTRIQTYKIARRMDNMAFLYTTTPLEMAEAMAFNLDCLGCVCWFEYGNIVRRPGETEPMASSLAPYIRFFRSRRDLMRDAEVVADIAVLRSYPSQAFADPSHAETTAQVEQALIERPSCFQIVYDHHLAQIQRYKVLVLAGCVAMSDAQAAAIERFVGNGGRVAVVGRPGTHDEWMRPRKSPVLAGLPPERVLHCQKPSEVVDGLRQAWPDALTLSVDGPAGLCCEVTEQPQRRLVHLVNYREDGPVREARVRLRVPGRVGQVALASPGRDADLPVPFEERDGAVEFTVPEVGVYEIAVVTLTN